METEQPGRGNHCGIPVVHRHNIPLSKSQETVVAYLRNLWEQELAVDQQTLVDQGTVEDEETWVDLEIFHPVPSDSWVLVV